MLSKSKRLILRLNHQPSLDISLKQKMEQDKNKWKTFVFALSRFISFFTMTQCMSGTSVWTLDNVAPFCCFKESSVDIVDICFYCHPHCMLSMCGV